jgi:RNA polymerase sigma factor (sigma-70 family)
MPKLYATDNSDAACWQRFINGDEQAFAEIFNRHYKRLCNYGYKIIPDKDLIKDCVQDLFIHLWHNRSRLVYTDAIQFYLIKSLRGKLLRLLKKQKSLNWETITSELPYFEFCFSHEENLAIGRAQDEQHDQLLKSLNSLPAKQKEIIYLRFLNDMSYLEIAEIMAINYQVVRNYACKAIKTLRKKVDLVLSLLLVLKQYSQLIDA